MLKKLRNTGTGLLTTVLWLGSVVLGIFEIIILRSWVQSLYAMLFAMPAQRYGQQYWDSVTLGNFTVLILGILAVVFFVGTGEYHARHLGSSGSRKLFAWTFGIQLLILLAYSMA